MKSGRSRDRFLHLAQILRDERMTLPLEQHEREGGILGGQRRTVVKACLLAQAECQDIAIRGKRRAFCDQPIDRARLVIGARHQRIEDEIEPLGRVALEDIAVERVEGGEARIIGCRGADLRKRAALRRIRIHIVEMRKVLCIFEPAEKRHAVSRHGAGDLYRLVPCGHGRQGRKRKAAETRGGGRARQDQEIAARKRALVVHCAPSPAFLFASAECHQMFGKPIA